MRPDEGQPPRQAKIEHLCELPWKVWIVYAMKDEPLRHRMTREQMRAYGAVAVQCGVRTAQQLRAGHSDLTVQQMLEQNHLELSWQEGPEAEPIFALFTEPAQITVFRNSIQRAVRFLQAEGVAEQPDAARLPELIMAHEFFHYLAAEDAGMVIHQKLLPIFHLGPLAYRSRVRILSEIAAMAFARELLQLPYAPYVWDWVLLCSCDAVQGQKLYEYILRIEAEEA